MIDEFTRYPVSIFLKDTNAETIIKNMMGS